MKRYFTILLATLAAATSCNKSETILTEPKFPPRIALDNPTGVYEVKVGHPLTIEPTVTNGEDADFYWIIDGTTVSRERTLTRTFAEKGEVYIDLKVVNKDGRDSIDMRVDVLDLELPGISLPLPSDGLTALTGREYRLEPTVTNSEGAAYLWTLDGTEVGTESSYTFRSETAGKHAMTFSVTNGDGTSKLSFAITVVESIPILIEFDPACTGADPLRRSVALDRKLWLRPRVGNVEKPAYAWSVDGSKVEGAEGSEFVFTPSHEGTATVTLRVTETAGDNLRSEGGVTEGENYAEATITVTVAGNESTLIRPASGSSSASWNKIYEYLPAPGQFINELLTGGFSGENTFAAAAAYAEKRMKADAWVSLGSFGGYIIAGFDHSIENKGGHQGYDFSVTGNQFDSSSEPGIVWVMQDTNGNGLPDDEWYQLKGSEWGKDGTVEDYAVTYYRPSAPGMNVTWTDNLGESGYVYYLGAFHTQEYYYPLWVEQSSYTLRGVRLASHTYQDPVTKNWVNGACDWGYADNFGSDRLSADGNVQAGPSKIYFKIANAVNPDGTDAALRFVDFIKVQSGVNVNIEKNVIGEVSTEVIGFTDENL